jgi:hypothetical protein
VVLLFLCEINCLICGIDHIGLAGHFSGQASDPDADCDR